MIPISLNFLKGKTLATLDRKANFDILNVDEGGIDIFLHSTKKGRHIAPRDIEESWAHLVTTGKLPLTYIMHVVNTQSSSYISAILTQVEGVTYELKPITLKYRR
jgi:hypothetical protein